MITMINLHAQSAFDVASVKPANPGSRVASLEMLPGGTLKAVNVSLRALVKKAYSVRDFQIAEAPSWFDSQRYDISAKAEGAAGDKQLELMLQSLLADRFKLKLRRETRDMQVYIITIGKSGVKLRETAPPDDGGTAGVRIRGVGRLTGIKGTIRQLAEALSDLRLNGSTILDRPVIDGTGLAGVYDFALEWTPDFGSSDGAVDRLGPSIFTAIQEQLGLKLDRRSAPVEVLIIEHVEKASEN
jgi:uncharacterized protein (TIGR03435 family)